MTRFGCRQPLNQKGDLLAAKLQRNVLLFVDTRQCGREEVCLMLLLFLLVQKCFVLFEHALLEHAWSEES